MKKLFLLAICLSATLVAQQPSTKNTASSTQDEKATYAPTRDLFTREISQVEADRILYFAATGDRQALQDLMKLRKDPNSPKPNPNRQIGSNGQTAVHIAAQYCHNPALFKYLTELDAHFDRQDKNGKTGMHYAATACNANAILALLQQKATPDIKDFQQQTAFDLFSKFIINHAQCSNKQDEILITRLLQD